MEIFPTGHIYSAVLWSRLLFNEAVLLPIGPGPSHMVALVGIPTHQGGFFSG